MAETVKSDKIAKIVLILAYATIATLLITLISFIIPFLATVAGQTWFIMSLVFACLTVAASIALIVLYSVYFKDLKYNIHGIVFSSLVFVTSLLYLIAVAMIIA